MNRVAVFVLIVASIAAPLRGAEKQYQTGKILDIQQKSRSRILYYIVNTPVTKDEPYYEVSIQLKDTIYTAEYTPRHAADALPESWKPDAEIELRVDKRHLFARRAGEVDLELAVIKHTPAASWKNTREAAPVPN